MLRSAPTIALDRLFGLRYSLRYRKFHRGAGCRNGLSRHLDSGVWGECLGPPLLRVYVGFNRYSSPRGPLKGACRLRALNRSWPHVKELAAHMRPAGRFNQWILRAVVETVESRVAIGL